MFYPCECGNRDCPDCRPHIRFFPLYFARSLPLLAAILDLGDLSPRVVMS